MDAPRLVLASTSPRRKRLLEEAGLAFDVEAPYVDERVARGTAPVEAAVALAVRKAEAVEARGRFVLAADTLLDLDGEILGKPRDAEDARAMLRRLSGRAHWVVTGVALRHRGEVRTGMAQTRVTFRALSGEEVAAYVATGEPLDKAGAYAIQGGAAGFVAEVRGAWDNVVGLPMDVVRTLLRDAGFPG